MSDKTINGIRILLAVTTFAMAALLAGRAAAGTGEPAAAGTGELCRRTDAGFARFPVMEIVVLLVYAEEAAFPDRGFDLALPRTVTPRYKPGTPIEDPPDVQANYAAAIPLRFQAAIPLRFQAAIPLRFQAAILPGFPPGGIWSDSHNLRIDRIGDRWEVFPEAPITFADLAVRWSGLSGSSGDRERGNEFLAVLNCPMLIQSGDER